VKRPLLNDSKYNALKQSVTIILPAVGALYFALAQIWNLPKSEEVVGSIASLNTFLGMLLGVSTKSYNKSDAKYAGALVVRETEEKKIFALELNEEPEKLENKDEVTFRIENDTGSNPIVTE